MVILYVLASVIIVSLISMIGLVFIRTQFLLAFVAFAAGVMLGSAFLHLLPKAIEVGSDAFLWVLIGILTFFVLERFTHWHHHKTDHRVHPFTWLVLVGDGIHNLIDGAIIAVAWLASPLLGVTTTIAIIAHEIPQEIGDFSILLYGGFSRRKALFWNFLSAVLAIFGALLAWTLSFYIHTLIPWFVAIAVGSFIYIATSDLIPEIHKERSQKRSIVELILFLSGLGLMMLL